MQILSEDDLGHAPAVREADAAIEVHDLVRRFETFTAVDRLSFRVKPGEVFGFLVYYFVTS